MTFPGSTKRLSWTSYASKRPLKYAQGKFGRVELVPQPSDDPDDPLVCSPPSFKTELLLTTHPELARLEKRAQLLVPAYDGRHDWCHEDDFYDR
jgi:hypothetical protein